MAKKVPPALIGPITAAISVVGLMIGIWALLQSYKSDTGAQIASIERHFDSRITALEQRMSSLEATLESVEFKLGELAGLIQAYCGAAARDGTAWLNSSGAVVLAPAAPASVTPTVGTQAAVAESVQKPPAGTHQALRANGRWRPHQTGPA